MTASNISITMPASKIVDFRSMMGKFNTKAKKHGISPIEIVSMEIGTMPYMGKTFQVTHVTFNKPSFHIGNFHVMAVHTNDCDTDLTFEFNGYKHDISQTIDYRRCDHCGVKHARKTVVLLNDGTEFKQVGNSCVKDYMGISLSTFNWLRDTILTLTDGSEWLDSDSFSRATPVYDVNDVLAYSYMACSTRGYHKTDEEYSTSTEVMDMILNNIVPTTVAVEWAKTAVDMLTNMLPTSNYEQNVHNIVKTGYVSLKMMGILCSSYIMVERELNKFSSVVKSTSKHVGELKQRITFNGKIVMAYGSHGFYGYKVMYIIEDNDGNQFKWVTNSVNHTKYATNESYQFTGTVVEHGDYKGTQQTVLSRCKTKEL